MSQIDALTPLIDLAAADDTISAAELDHLILEAKMRGVSEADARAYLSTYAAARRCQLGQAQAGSHTARPKADPGLTGSQTPPPQTPRPPQSEPVEAAGPASPRH